MVRSALFGAGGIGSRRKGRRVSTTVVWAGFRRGGYPNGTLAVFHGPRHLAVYNADGTPIDATKEDKEAA